MVKSILKLDTTNLKNIHEIKKKDSPPINLKSMKSSAQSLKIEEIEKNYIKELSNKYDQESNFLSVSICLRVKYWICPNRINDRERFLLKLFLKAEEMINSKMDVINFMKIIQEFNYVKCLLFDDVHSLCLSFFKKPKVLEKNIFKINYKSHQKI
jgi:hypothetical protein